MWSRADLKNHAKKTMKIHYWRMFLVAFVMVLIGATSLSGPYSFDSIKDSTNEVTLEQFGIESPFGEKEFNSSESSQLSLDSFKEKRPEEIARQIFQSPWLTLLVGAAAFGGLLFIIGAVVVWRVFLGFPMEVGCRKYFLKNASDEAEYKLMTSVFNNSVYWNVVKTMFMRALFNFLWYLLLFIPGVVKAYAYRMVPYILAENPNLTYKEAIQLSMDMTKGYKLDMWILDLSFMGWYLLGFFMIGLGGLFVNPYYEAVQAELYIVLSENALEEGICSLEILNRPGDSML